MFRSGIAFAYYAVPFSKANVKKLDKILSKLTKEIYNIPKITTNILTHLSNNDFGIITTSLSPDYINNKGQQQVYALNDSWQLGIIHQGLTKYISVVYGESLHLLELKHQAWSKPPIVRTLFTIKRI